MSMECPQKHITDDAHLRCANLDGVQINRHMLEPSRTLVEGNDSRKKESSVGQMID